MVKRFILAAVVLALVFGGVIGFKLYKQAAIKDYLGSMAKPEVHLNGTVAKAENWDQQLAAIGSLRARQGIDIRSEVGGVVRQVHVVSRQKVTAGELIVELDDTVDRATLKSARVRLEQTRREFQRDRALFEKGLASEDKFDTSRSDFESAEALVEETQGIIDKKSIRAPFTGTLGIHNLNEGQYLEAGDQVVSLQALDTLYLDLNLPEKELGRLHPGQQVSFTVPSHGDKVFKGTVKFVDVVVQTTTRNVLVRAEVENPDRELLPGMFAHATIILNEARELITVPRQAVAFSLYGETVYLLEKSGSGGKSGWSARRMAVKTGEVRDGRIAVTGLEPGQMIALDTQHRLLNGTPVVIENRADLEADKTGTESN